MEEADKKRPVEASADETFAVKKRRAEEAIAAKAKAKEEEAKKRAAAIVKAKEERAKRQVEEEAAKRQKEDAHKLVESLLGRVVLEEDASLLRDENGKGRYARRQVQEGEETHLNNDLNLNIICIELY